MYIIVVVLVRCGGIQSSRWLAAQSICLGSVIESGNENKLLF